MYQLWPRCIPCYPDPQHPYFENYEHRDAGFVFPCICEHLDFQMRNKHFAGKKTPYSTISIPKVVVSLSASVEVWFISVLTSDVCMYAPVQHSLHFIHFTSSPWKPWFVKMFISIHYCCSVCFCVLSNNSVMCDNCSYTTIPQAHVLLCHRWVILNLTLVWHVSKSKPIVFFFFALCLSAQVLSLNLLCWHIIEEHTALLSQSGVCLPSLSLCLHRVFTMTKDFIILLYLIFITSTIIIFFRHRLVSLSISLPIVPPLST